MWKIIIDSTLDRTKVFRRNRIGTRFGPGQVLGCVVGQVGPFQNFGANQMCSSKHLDRTRSGPGSEQIRRVNSILQVPGPLYNTLRYNTVLDLLITVGPRFAICLYIKYSRYNTDG